MRKAKVAYKENLAERVNSSDTKTPKLWWEVVEQALANENFQILVNEK